MDPDTDGLVAVSVLPAGSLNSIFTVTGTSPIAGSKSAMQIRVTVDLIGRTMSGLTWFVEILIAVGLGTEDKKKIV